MFLNTIFVEIQNWKASYYVQSRSPAWKINFWRPYLLQFPTFLKVSCSTTLSPNVHFYVQQTESNFVDHRQSSRKNTNTSSDETAPDKKHFIFYKKYIPTQSTYITKNDPNNTSNNNTHHNRSIHQRIHEKKKLSLPQRDDKTLSIWRVGDT